jgi:hypothetical protein
VSAPFSISERISARFFRMFRRISKRGIVASYVVASLLAVLVARFGGRAAAPFVAMGALSCTGAAAWLFYVFWQLLARHDQAVNRWDLDELARLRKLFNGVGPPVSVLDRNMRLVGDGEELLMREKYADARQAFESIDRAALPAISRPGILSLLAYATAVDGDPARGVTLARDAIAEAEAQGGAYPREKMPYLLARCGIALSLAGEHELALEVLTDAVVGGLAEAWLSVALWYSSRSFLARGEPAYAREQAEWAAELRGPFAERARAELGRVLN